MGSIIIQRIRNDYNSTFRKIENENCIRRLKKELLFDENMAQNPSFSIFATLNIIEIVNFYLLFEITYVVVFVEYLGIIYMEKLLFV